MIVTAIAIVTTLTSCDRAGDGSGDGRLSVVAAAYPLAEAATRVGGDLVRVRNLTPPGAEPHDLELAPDDLEAVVTADLVVYVGRGFQPAVEDAVELAEGRVLDALTVVETLAVGGEGGGTVDPHVWLDPMRQAEISRAVAGALGELDPADADRYREGAEAYAAELAALDAEFRAGLRTCSSRLLVVTHAAFGYLASAYDLVQEPIAGLSPESEPDPVRLAELEGLVRAEGVTTVFAEELVPPDVARTLAQEAGVAVAVLNPLEGLTEAQLDAGEDYGSIMRRNLATLEAALGCS